MGILENGNGCDERQEWHNSCPSQDDATALAGMQCGHMIRKALLTYFGIPSSHPTPDASASSSSSQIFPTTAPATGSSQPDAPMYQPAVATGTLAVDSTGAISMLDQLVGMGFPLLLVQVALSHTNDLHAAITLLTDPSHVRNLVEKAAPLADDMRSPAPASSSSSYIIPTTAPATGSSQPHSLPFPFPLPDRRSVAWHHNPGSSPQVLIQGKADELQEALDAIYAPAFKQLREARLQSHDSPLTITKIGGPSHTLRCSPATPIPRSCSLSLLHTPPVHLINSTSLLSLLQDC